jgi:hypothetical protein
MRRYPARKLSRYVIAALALVLVACGGDGATGPRGSGGDGGTTIKGPDLPATDIFVDSASGNDSAAGTWDHPVSTVARAIELASDGGITIRIAAGTYVEAITLGKHVDVYGGYQSATWKRDTAAFRTRLRDSARVIHLQYADSVVLDGLDIATLDSSRYATVVLDSSVGVVIRGSRILARRAADGRNAPHFGSSVADSGGVGDPGQPAHGCPPSVYGGIGGDWEPAGYHGGTGGTGGLLGGFDGDKGKGSGGAAGGKAGAAFTVGGAGKSPNATPPLAASGGGGKGFGRYADRYVAADGQRGAEGEGGYGGGGGGGGGGIFVLAICGGGGGGGGQGGVGGFAGYGGWGGEASIAIVVGRGSDLRLESSEVVTEGGGRGGNGAAGQLGGYGGKGGAGGAAAAGAAAGGKGGTGGRGGSGGWGGGGGGGPSVGVLVLAGGALTEVQVRYQIGPGGAAGTSREDDATGLAGDSLPVKRLGVTP